MASTALKAVGEWDHVRLADSVDQHVGDVKVGEDWANYIRSSKMTGNDFVTELQQGPNAVCEYFELNCGCDVTPYIVTKWMKGLRADLGVDNSLATSTVDDATAQQNMATIPRLDSNYGVFETGNSVEPSLPVEDNDIRDSLDVSFSELPVFKQQAAQHSVAMIAGVGGGYSSLAILVIMFVNYQLWEAQMSLLLLALVLSVTVQASMQEPLLTVQNAVASLLWLVYLCSTFSLSLSLEGFAVASVLSAAIATVFIFTHRRWPRIAAVCGTTLSAFAIVFIALTAAAFALQCSDELALASQQVTAWLESGAAAHGAKEVASEDSWFSAVFSNPGADENGGDRGKSTVFVQWVSVVLENYGLARRADGAAVALRSAEIWWGDLSSGCHQVLVDGFSGDCTSGKKGVIAGDSVADESMPPCCGVDLDAPPAQLVFNLICCLVRPGAVVAAVLCYYFVTHKDLVVNMAAAVTGVGSSSTYAAQIRDVLQVRWRWLPRCGSRRRACFTSPSRCVCAGVPVGERGEL